MNSEMPIALARLRTRSDRSPRPPLAPPASRASVGPISIGTLMTTTPCGRTRRSRSCEHLRLYIRWTVLQHFHADDGIVVTAWAGVAQLLDRREATSVHTVQPSPAVAQLLDVDVGANRFAKEIVRERDEGSVAAAVIEQRPAGARRGELARQRKPAAMTPGNDRVAG